MRRLVLSLSPAFVLLAACSTSPKTTEFRADRVVGRSDDMSSRPEWVTETVSVVEKGDKVHVIGVVEVPGDSRPQAAFKASDAAARGHLANKIETQLTKIVESSESGFSMDDQRLQSLIREVSRVTFNDLDVKNRYWEKAVRTKSDGQEELVLKSFSLLQMPTSDVKKHVASAVKKSRDVADSGTKNTFEKLVLDRFTVGDLTHSE